MSKAQQKVSVIYETRERLGWYIDELRRLTQGELEPVETTMTESKAAYLDSLVTGLMNDSRTVWANLRAIEERGG